MNTSVATKEKSVKHAKETLVPANEIYLQKRLRILIPEGRGSSKHPRNRQMVATFNKNIEDLGYTFSESLFKELSRCESREIENLYKEIVPILQKMKGANVRYRPMYPNFPQQVIDASLLELYVNAIVHYWSDGAWTPEYAKEARFPLGEKHKLDIIELGNEDDFKSIFTSILGSNTSISASDKEIIVWFIRQIGYAELVFPEVISQKENLCFLIGNVLTYLGEENATSLIKYIRTATDVLRLAVSFSGGDVSLAENTKFKKFSRPERRFFLSALENCGNIQEDMVRYPEQWIRLGERLHPGEYAGRFPKSFEGFKAIRENAPIKTFNSEVELALQNESILNVTELLSKRPGDFARRLDHVFRKATRKYQRNKVITEFLSVADKVSTPVLLQLYAHFKNRHVVQDTRSFFIKGNLAKIKVIPNKLDQLDKEMCVGFAEKVREVLVERFSKLPKLGNVFIDNSLSNYLVPFSQRSASKTLKTIVRGSKIPLDGDYDTIRFFIHWTNTKECNGGGPKKRGDIYNYASENPGRVDIDLSAYILDENWAQKDTISYYNLRNFGGHHSGDFVNAPLPNGASEFIDVSLKRVLAAGGRYIAMCINSYTQTPYCDLPECFAGWMGRKQPNSGEVFEAKTVKNKFDIGGDTCYVIPLLIDCELRQVVWMDLSLKHGVNWGGNNVASNRHNTSLVCKAINELKKPNLYDLMSIHCDARGAKLVKDPKKAAFVFDEQFACEIDKIASEYLV